jgi:hypothetical protein
MAEGTSSKLKKGKLSAEEIRIILEQSNHKTDEEIGLMLNRSAHTIANNRKRAQSPNIDVEESPPQPIATKENVNLKPLKKGVLSDEEVGLILEQSAYKTDEELALMLNRSISMVAIGRKRAELVGADKAKKAEGEQILKQYALITKPFWKDLKTQFSADELRLAQELWYSLYQQFGEDVTTTEELQIIDLIQVQILINRNLTERQGAQKTIHRLEIRLNEEFAKAQDEQNTDLIVGLTNEINMGSRGQQARTTEYKNLLEKKQMLMKDVKGTRDQRYKEIKESKDTLFNWIKSHNEKLLRQEESHLMELHRIASEKEKLRLSSYHEYMDNTVDRPLLNSESVLLEEKENEEDEQES